MAAIWRSTVEEFCERVFAEAGLDYREYVKIDERFKRPAEIDTLVGDPARARKVLGWVPEYTFADLIKEMVASDLKATAEHAGKPRSTN